MCIMGPSEIKQDIYNVMISSREFANYCQESVKSIQSKKISNSLNNFHLKTSIDFITNLLINDDRSIFESNKIDFDYRLESNDKPIYNKVIDYIEDYLIESDL